MNLQEFPNCRTRLHFQRVDVQDKGMTKYWAAVCVAEDFKDVDLAIFGGFNFDDMSDENGHRLLTRLEEFMGSRRDEKSQNAPIEAAQ